MSGLKKEYVQELLHAQTFSRRVIMKMIWLSEQKQGLYPILVLQLCSDPSVRPLWGARMAQGLSNRLQPMWPGSKSRYQCHMWVESVVGYLPCSERFLSGYSSFPPSSKTIIFNSNSTRNGRRTTNVYIIIVKSDYKSLFTILLIYLLVYSSIFGSLES